MVKTKKTYKNIPMCDQVSGKTQKYEQLLHLDPMTREVFISIMVFTALFTNPAPHIVMKRQCLCWFEDGWPLCSKGWVEIDVKGRIKSWPWKSCEQILTNIKSSRSSPKSELRMIQGTRSFISNYTPKNFKTWASWLSEPITLVDPSRS